MGGEGQEMPPKKWVTSFLNIAKMKFAIFRRVNDSKTVKIFNRVWMLLKEELKIRSRMICFGDVLDE